MRRGHFQLNELIAVTLFIVLSHILAGQASASISGYVTDTGGQTVEGALITFTDEANPDNYFLDYTDETGRYEVTLSPLSVADEPPAPFSLLQNYPNPFNPSTTIPYTLSTAGHVRLDIFSITGQRIARLVDAPMAAGLHTATWNGRDADGKAVGAGIYLYRLTAGNLSKSRKMLLLDGGGVTMRQITSQFSMSHESAKPAEGLTFHVSITGNDIVSYEVSGLTVVDGGSYNFIVQRRTVIHGMTLVGIPGGTFQMGDVENAGFPEEKPVHTVTVSTFEMGVYEVTNTQYAAYLNAALALGDITATFTSVKGATGAYANMEYIYIAGMYPPYLDSRCWISYNGNMFRVEPGHENWPVVWVTWYGSKAFALYYGLNLPTEAEWEYACRGGRQYMYGTDDGTISTMKANYWGNGIQHPVTVGNYSANPYGLYDMSGNVWEWCHDWYGAYASGSAENPSGALTGSSRMQRGGGWGDSADLCRAALRWSSGPADRSRSRGFRIVRHPSPQNF